MLLPLLGTRVILERRKMVGRLRKPGEKSGLRHGQRRTSARPRERDRSGGARFPRRPDPARRESVGTDLEHDDDRGGDARRTLDEQGGAG